MFKLMILPLSKQLCNLAGNVWSRALVGGRAERNEFLLLHEFHREKYIVPDKKFKQTNSDSDHKPTKKKPAYAGGLVLEPKKGLYDKFVVMLDFNSLYPSIIQEFNVCFTTVSRNEAEDIPKVPDTALDRGILPRLLATLVDRRRQVKQLMKEPKITKTQYNQYDIRQKALKLTANSMYGCLGFTHSRFYAKPLAMLITSKGREILQNTVDLAEREGLEVIYGDTDSIMIHTNTDNFANVQTIGNQLKKLVNERYKLLEIEMDGFYKRMLLLKKKKYAALMIDERNGKAIVEIKGLDLVRRDWCGLSHDLSNFVLNEILSDKNRDEAVDAIHDYLCQAGKDIREEKIELEKFVINKGLTRAPESYNDAKSQPHVQVALAMKKQGKINVRVGDTIPYVICKGSEASFALRARHPDDIKLDPVENQIDFEWYLHNQVHPPIARLCEPIQGTDSARIADCLGLDSSKYRRSYQNNPTEEDNFCLLSQMNKAERFKNVEPWNAYCVNCEKYSRMNILIPPSEENGEQTGLKCVHCSSPFPIASLLTQLKCVIHKHIRRYIEGWMVCDDSACKYRTNQKSVHCNRCPVQLCRGSMKPEFSDFSLYNQLVYFHELVHYPGHKNNHPQRKYYEELGLLKGVIDAYLEKNDRRFIDLKNVFSFMM